MALALDCYVEVEVEPAVRFELRAHGHGADLPQDRSHLAARIAIEVTGHDSLAIDVSSDIPVGRGLGSSAALAVAAAAAAGASDPFAYGVRTDGHAENAAASAFGGLVVATFIGDQDNPVWRSLPLDPALRFVAVIPDLQLPTEEARAPLPAKVPHRDAGFNLGRMGLLVAGLADRHALLPEAGDDRLHQDQRTPLFPEAPVILAGLRAAGALTSFWSGAGPTMLGVCDERDADRVAAAAIALLDTAAIAGQVRVLRADQRGITLLRPRDQ